MDGRFRPRTITSRPAASPVPVEHRGNVATLRFDLRPDLGRLSTRAWYHEAAIRTEASGPVRGAGQDHE